MMELQAEGLGVSLFPEHQSVVTSLHGKRSRTNSHEIKPYLAELSLNAQIKASAFQDGQLHLNLNEVFNWPSRKGALIGGDLADARLSEMPCHFSMEWRNPEVNISLNASPSQNLPLTEEAKQLSEDGTCLNIRSCCKPRPPAPTQSGIFNPFCLLKGCLHSPPCNPTFAFAASMKECSSWISMPTT